MRLKALRQRFIGAIGVRATHAAEDGGVLGILFGLTLTFPPAAALVVAAIVGDGLGPRKLLAVADQVVRQEDVRQQPIYFAGAFLGGGALGVGFGLGGAAIAAWSGVSLPAVPL